MKVRDLVPGVWTGKPLQLRRLYSAADLEQALKSPPTPQTVTIKNPTTGEIIGKRTIYQR